MSVLPGRDTQVCLVSAQATPNITPALDPAIRPRRILLVVSPDMDQRARWLTQALEPTGVVVERWPIADAWDLEHIYERLFELVAGPLEGVDSALNATGGTKPMSIAAFQVFRDAKRPVFYVHPEQDRILWLDSSGAPAHPLADRVRLPMFLQAHGARVIGPLRQQPVASERRALTSELARQARHWARALGQLNALAKEAESHRRLLTAPVEAPAGGNTLAELVERFRAAGLLAWEGDRLRFPDEDARFYVNGGWLEEYVYGLLYGLRRDVPQIQDLAHSVRVQRARGVENELDVALLAANRLHVVECKTARMHAGPDEGPGKDALFRLETLRDLLGGLASRAMLVSYRPMPPALRTRAADLGIDLVQADGLATLEQRLRRWVAVP